MSFLLAMLPAALGGAATAVGATATGLTAAEVAAGVMGPTMAELTATAAAPSILGSVASYAPLLLNDIQMVSGIAGAQNEAAIMEANAEMARRSAVMQQEAGKSDTLKLSREKRQMIGEQVAAFGASGLNVSEGSPLEVMMQTARNFERDIQTTGYNADNRAWSQLSQAAIDEYSADQTRNAGWWKTAGTMLTGLSSYAARKKFGIDPSDPYGMGSLLNPRGGQRFKLGWT